jgi:hypothetical protein
MRRILYLTKHHVMKTYGEAEVQLHAFLTTAIDGVSGQLHAKASLPREKSSWYPLDRRLEVVPKKKFPALAMNRTPVVQSVARSIFCFLKIFLLFAPFRGRSVRVRQLDY